MPRSSRLLPTHGGYFFSISSIWAPSGASTKATWWPLLPSCSSMMCAPLLLSLAIAPAFVLAQRARWVDLDGPALLERDREGGFEYREGRIGPPVG